MGFPTVPLRKTPLFIAFEIREASGREATRFTMAPHEGPSLLPNAVDQIAAEEPESLYGKYPANPTDYSAGFESVTFAQLANAANRVAWWLENEVGRGNEDQTLLSHISGPMTSVMSSLSSGPSRRDTR